MSIEAMKQALEALEEYQANGPPFMACDAAVLVLRTAIEQAERDWSLLEATQESLREHMAEIKRLKQRQWVGLTAKDLAEIPPSAYEGAIWADAKLKEKNT